MDIDAALKNIHRLQKTLSGVNADVSLTYKPDLGITKPWYVRAGDSESSQETHEAAIIEVTRMLKSKLADKAKSAENEANRLRAALNQAEN